MTWRLSTPKTAYVVEIILIYFLGRRFFQLRQFVLICPIGMVALLLKKLNMQFIIINVEVHLEGLVLRVWMQVRGKSTGLSSLSNLHERNSKKEQKSTDCIL